VTGISFGSSFVRGTARARRAFNCAMNPRGWPYLLERCKGFNAVKPHAMDRDDSRVSPRWRLMRAATTSSSWARRARWACTTVLTDCTRPARVLWPRCAAPSLLEERRRPRPGDALAPAEAALGRARLHVLLAHPKHRGLLRLTRPPRSGPKPPRRVRADLLSLETLGLSWTRSARTCSRRRLPRTPRAARSRARARGRGRSRARARASAHGRRAVQRRRGRRGRRPTPRRRRSRSRPPRPPPARRAAPGDPDPGHDYAAAYRGTLEHYLVNPNDLGAERVRREPGARARAAACSSTCAARPRTSTSTCSCRPTTRACSRRSTAWGSAGRSRAGSATSRRSSQTPRARTPDGGTCGCGTSPRTAPRRPNRTRERLGPRMRWFGDGVHFFARIARHLYARMTDAPPLDEARALGDYGVVLTPGNGG